MPLDRRPQDLIHNIPTQALFDVELLLCRDRVAGVCISQMHLCLAEIMDPDEEEATLKGITFYAGSEGFVILAMDELVDGSIE